MKAFLAVLLISIAVASAQYVRVTSFEPSSGCTSQPLVHMYYTPNVCIPLPGGVTSTGFWVNGTSINVWTCNNSNCTASGCTEMNVNASVCYQTSMGNVTTGYTTYELNINITADFANPTTLPAPALGVLNYASGCDGVPLGGAIFYSGSLCSSPAPGSFVDLQCSSTGCLSASASCSMNATTHMCQGCSNTNTPLTKGCQASFGFPAWIGCGNYNENLCTSSNSTTTTTASATSSTTGGAVTGTTSTGGSTTGSATGTTGTGAGTTGSAFAVVASGFLVALAAMLSML